MNDGLVDAVARAPRVSPGAPRPVLAPAQQGYPRRPRTRQSAERVLSRTLCWWPSGQYRAGDRRWRNLGIGGSELDLVLGGSLAGPTSNDPLHLSRNGGPAYLYFPGIGGNGCYAPDAANLDITDDIDIMVLVAPDSGAPAATSILLSKSGGAGTRAFEFFQDSTASGKLGFRFTLDGSVNNTYLTSVTAGLADGVPVWLRVLRRRGAGTIDFYKAPFSLVPPSVANMSQIGTTVTGVDTGAMFASSSVVAAGQGASAGQPFAGKFYRALVRDSIEGAAALDMDATLITSGSAISWVTTTGQTISIARGSAGRKTVAVVEAIWSLGTDDFWSILTTNRRLHAALDLRGNESMAVMAVTREWDTPVQTSGTLSRHPRSIIGAGWMLRHFDTSHTYRFQMSTRDADATAIADIPGVAGQLRVAAAVVDRSARKLTTYANGVAANSTPIGHVNDCKDADFDLRVGAVNSGAAAYLDAEVRALAIWKNDIPTPRELALVSSYYGGGS